MKRTKVLFLSFLFFPLLLMADMPGNKPRPDCSLQIKGIEKLSKYDFFYTLHGNMEPKKITDSSELTIIGGYGVPSSVSIFGKNKITGNQTQTIYLYNNLDETNMVISIDTIIGDSLIQYQELKRDIAKKDNINIGKSVIDDNEKSNNWLLIGLGFLALDILILVYFVRRRKRRQMAEKNNS